MGEHIAVGSHLLSWRLLYTHHGIYVGDDRVVHYSGNEDGVVSGSMEETSLDAFRAGAGYWVKAHDDARFSPEEIVSRARSRLGEDNFDLLNNNGEQFCEWCITGESGASSGVDMASLIGKTVFADPPALAGNEGEDWLAGRKSTYVSAAARTAGSAVSAAGSVAGLSAAGIASGLAAIGGTVGGGMAAGAAITAAAPAAAAAAVGYGVYKILKRVKE
ncbi:Lecithin retinol acyltransferase [Solimonas aquatica]|uniref:Lecithin retinol acyltransferase n=1 Tax=Solimonas aquatica TaxID=489703 RepID=A0A1H9GJ27_9GAMM|nr:lecithin retinol acyltransferase family protein [Solimonas aquatica]SEQ50095.1 Lecithin retinol acyltransferase [Solimonas aquatica]